jgi:hypothetical protein
VSGDVDIGSEMAVISKSYKVPRRNEIRYLVSSNILSALCTTLSACSAMV